MAELTSTGLTIDTVSEILAEIEAEQRALISPELNQTSASVLGQLNGIFARQARKLQELAQAVYRAYDPDQATGDALDSVAALTGTLRRAATKSTVVATVELEDGFSAAAGDMIAYVDGDATARFTNRDAVENTSGDTALVDVVFEAEVTGPVRANVETLTQIAEPLSGWLSISNYDDDATLGELVETDEALRLRREQELGSSGSGIDAIARALSDLDGMQSVQVIENVSDDPGNGLSSGHAFEAVVYDGTDGVTPVVEDATIGEAIWSKKPAGIAAVGSTDVEVTDYLGNTQTVSFSRAEQVAVDVSIALEVGDDYAGDAAVLAAITAWGDASLTVGADVRIAHIICAALEVEGVIDVTEVQLGTEAVPLAPANVSIGSRQVAVFGSVIIDSGDGE